MPQTPYRKQLDVLSKATLEAGKMAATFQEKGFKRLENKEKGDPFLTEADLALDKFLKETLLEAFPDYGWLSEETETDKTSLDKEFCWIVDPIDGTRGFINGKSSFSVSVGLVHNGKPVAGGVCAPMDDILITGAIGEGVFVNGAHVLNNNEKAEKRGHQPYKIYVSSTEVNMGIWEAHKNKFELKPLGSVAYKLALLAAGYGDGVISLKPKNLHDVCAGHGLLNAMGGYLKNIDNKDIPYTTPDYLLSGVVAGTTAPLVDAFFQHLHQSAAQIG